MKNISLLLQQVILCIVNKAVKKIKNNSVNILTNSTKIKSYIQIKIKSYIKNIQTKWILKTLKLQQPVKVLIKIFFNRIKGTLNSNFLCEKKVNGYYKLAKYSSTN